MITFPWRIDITVIKTCENLYNRSDVLSYKEAFFSSNFHRDTFFHLITNANFMTFFTVWIFLNMNSIFLLLSINSFFPGLHYRTGHHMTTSDRKFGVWWGQVLAKTRNVPTCPEMVLCQIANFTSHKGAKGEAGAVHITFSSERQLTM